MALPLPFTTLDLQGEPVLAKNVVIAGRNIKQLVVEAGFGGSTGGGSSVINLSRLQVAQLYPIFEHNFTENILDTLIWHTKFTGAGSQTYLTDEKAQRLTVTGAAVDSVIRQTKQYFPYSFGQLFNADIGALLDSPVANVRKRIGYFDVNDGFFWQQDGTGLSIVGRSSTSGVPVDTVIPQASWNVDKFDGSGPSGVTLDVTKAQLFHVEIHGRPGVVRLGFIVNGAIQIAHEFFSANTLAFLIARVVTLPVRLEIANTALSAGASIKHYGARTAADAELTKFGTVRSVDNDNTNRNVSAALLPLVSIRLKAANIRGTLFPESLQVLITSSNDVYWQLILNGTLTAPTWVSVGATSMAEVDVVASAIAGGTVIDSGYTSNAIYFHKDIKSRFPIVSDIDAVPDTLTLAAKRIVGAGNTSTFGQLNFKEVY